MLDTMTSNIPTASGHITLSHWSNGDPNWSGGPPATDAILTVEYVKGYFNSSTVQRQNDWRLRCPDIKTINATCAIPEVSTAPNGNFSAKSFFFSQEKNMTVNQTVSGVTGRMKSEGFAIAGNPRQEMIIWTGILGLAGLLGWLS